MAPSATQQVLLSPAELSYLHTSLSLAPSIRPDGRTLCQFRPLIAETDILPGTNGSARICFADGTEAIVGVKAEVEKSRPGYQAPEDQNIGEDDDDEADEDVRRNEKEAEQQKGLNEWVEMSVEIPGFRDDDSMPVFLAAMLSEALLADGEFTRRLWINRRFHWKLYVDVSFNIFSYMCTSNVETDFAAFSAIVISTAPAVSHHTSCSTFYKTTKVKVRAR
jgi:exosome complex component RRP42